MKTQDFPLLLICVLFFACQGISQELEFGEVSDQDLKMKVYEKDSSAPAVVLYRYRKSFYEYSERGWLIVHEFHERVKILKPEGLDFATRSVSAYIKKEDVEVTGIQGITHKLVDGVREKIKLRKEGIFKNNLSEWENTYTWTMPQVQVGSVIEWKYTTKSPYPSHMDELMIQDNIPVRDFYAEIRLPGFLEFRHVRKGFIDFEPEFTMEKRSGSVTYSKKTWSGRASARGNMTISEVVARYRLEHVPSLNEEPYTNDLSNYRAGVAFELISFKKGDGKEKIANTWNDVATAIFEEPNFGGRLKKTSFLDELAKDFRSQHADSISRMRAIYDYIKERFTWNGRLGVYTERDLEDVFEMRTASVGEINLILFSLMRKARLEVYPVLSSTRDYTLPVFPTMSGFNYVTVAFKSQNNYILLDASDKYAVPDVLPERAYNWEGRLVSEFIDSEAIPMYNKNAAQENVVLSYNLESNGKISGNVQHQYVDYKALKFRKTYERQSAKEALDTAVQTYKLDGIGNYKVKGIENLYDPVLEQFDFNLDKAYDVVGDNIYLKPLLFFAQTENPFLSEKRQYPINFIHPYHIKTLVRFSLPDEYEVIQIPESTSIVLPENMGSFSFRIGGNGREMTLLSDLKILKANISQDFYPLLKKFFTQLVASHSNQIVMAKTQP